MEIVGLIAIAALVALNGYFVAAEFSLVAIRKTRVEEMVRQGVRGAKSVEAAVTNLDRTIAATQLGITLASLALGWIGESTLERIIEPLFGFMPENWRAVWAHTVAIVIAFTLITFMHVIFGELMPKSVALQVPDRTALWVAAPLNVFAKVASPIIKVMNGSGNWMLRRLGFHPAGTEGHIHSVQELQMLVEDTQEAGLIDEEQAEFVQNVFLLTDKTVRECMVPREKMDSLEIRTPSDKVMEVVRRCGHTRIPVYDGEPDNIVGILNTKNLFYFFSLANVVVLEDALYPATYLDPEETLDNALRLFRRSRRPMALVRDETGKIHGLLTLEDVVEEIVGDIEDEHDAPVPKLMRHVKRRGPPPKK